MRLGLSQGLSTGGFVPSGVTLLLDEDDVPAAAVAVGMRKLRADYTGYAMRVTSYSDNNNIADVSFDSDGFVSASSPVTQAGGSITASTLGELSGSDYLYTTIWYDQSGNGRNFTNSTLSAQPFITYAGTLQDAPLFDGSNDFLGCGYEFSSTGDDDYTYTSVCKTSSASTTQGLFSDLQGGSFNSGIEVNAVSSVWRHHVDTQDLVTTLATSTNKALVNASFSNDGSSNNHRLRLDGSQQQTTTSENITGAARGILSIGCRRSTLNSGTFVNGWVGNIYEAVCFETQLTDAQSEALEANMAAHYSITLA